MLPSQSCFFQVYIAHGKTPDGVNLCKVGFSERPKRRYKRFAKHYGVDCTFNEFALLGVPTRSMAYALEQTILHKCASKFPSFGHELFAAEPDEVFSIAKKLYEVMV